MQFPASIDIPVTVAAGIVLGDDLTARDQATLLAVLWYAGRHGVSDDGLVDIPDLALRKAFGGLKSRSLDRADAAYVRLKRAVVSSDERLPDVEDGIEAPVVQPGMRRVRVAGAFRWQVDPALAAAFAVENDEPVVSVPMTLLAGARCRYTLIAYLRMSAWLAGDVDRHHVVRKAAWRTTLKLMADELAEAIAGAAVTPARFERNALAPAIDEIRLHSELEVGYTVLRAPRTKAARAFELSIEQQVRSAPMAREVRTTAKGFGSMPSAKVIAITLPQLTFTKRPTRTVVLPDEPTSF